MQDRSLPAGAVAPGLNPAPPPRHEAPPPLPREAAPNEAPEKTPTEARQGETPHITRYVLGYGLALAVIAMVAAYAFGVF